MKPNSYASKIIAGLLLPAFLSISSLHAADAVSLTDLRIKIGKCTERCQYTVITRTGTSYRSQGLSVDSTAVYADKSTVPLCDIVAIKIKHHRGWWSAIGGPAGAMTGDGNIFWVPWIGIPLLPVVLAVTVAGAPVTVSMEALKRLRPAKVITVQP